MNPREPLIDPKKEAFAQHYCVDGNTTSAARAAGVSYAVGRRMVEDVAVQRRIQALLEQQFEHVGVTAERVKAEIARAAFQSAKDLYDENGRLLEPHELPDDVAATIAGIEVEVIRPKAAKLRMGGDEDDDPVILESESTVIKKIKRVDKLAALTLLARHFKIVGAEDDGVNQLASALADRLNKAKHRLGEVEDATIIDGEPAALPTPVEPVTIDLPQPAAEVAALQENSDEPLW